MNPRDSNGIDELEEAEKANQGLNREHENSNLEVEWTGLISQKIRRKRQKNRSGIESEASQKD